MLEEGEEDTTAGEDAEAGGGGGGGRGSDGKDGKDAWNKEHPKKASFCATDVATFASTGNVAGCSTSCVLPNSVPLCQVKVLSKEEAEAASIFDVVLPLPGMSMQYPANEMRKT